MEINHPQWTVSSCFSYLYIWMISNIRFANNFDKSGISNYTVLTELIHVINIGVIS